jgi:ribonuclease-3
MEAVLAAVYLDQGYEAVTAIVRDLLQQHSALLLQRAAFANAKSRLQELAQVRLRLVPRYELIGRTGPAHDSRFEVRVSAGDLAATGRGTSRQAAEQAAASSLLERLHDALATAAPAGADGTPPGAGGG